MHSPALGSRCFPWSFPRVPVLTVPPCHPSQVTCRLITSLESQRPATPQCQWQRLSAADLPPFPRPLLVHLPHHRPPAARAMERYRRPSGTRRGGPGLVAGSRRPSRRFGDAPYRRRRGGGPLLRRGRLTPGSLTATRPLQGADPPGPHDSHTRPIRRHC